MEVADRRVHWIIYAGGAGWGGFAGLVTAYFIGTPSQFLPIAFVLFPVVGLAITMLVVNWVVPAVIAAAR
jgi:hypothetical protein